MALISVASRIERAASGRMMRRTRCHQVAPSIIAASSTSWLIDWMPRKHDDHAEADHLPDHRDDDGEEADVGAC